MNYQLMAEILEESKSWLWDGQFTHTTKTMYVCIAIADTLVVKGGPERIKAVKALRSWIDNALGPYNETVTDWLKSQGINIAASWGPQGYATMQSYRLAWIDQMIKILRS